jgi:hypothetical protein
MGSFCLAASSREGLFRLRRSGFRLLAGVDWELRSQWIVGFQPAGGALINSPPDGGESTGPEAQSTVFQEVGF